jgi:hypothetical protein
MRKMLTVVTVAKEYLRVKGARVACQLILCRQDTQACSGSVGSKFAGPVYRP